MAWFMIGIKSRRTPPLSDLTSIKRHFIFHLEGNGFLTEAFCAAAAASVLTLSGAVLVLVTFLVFSHHPECSPEPCLTFEAPRGGLLEDLTFMSMPPPALRSLSAGHSRPQRRVLTSCCCPQLPRELTGLCSLTSRQ